VRAPEAAPPAAVAPKPAPAPNVPAAAAHVVVRPGDNLWLIARTALGHPVGHPPSEAEVARYWHAVIAANRATLRSGNPSLVFPGEIVALPAPTGVS
jgi:nucleoid-associated protein YgaU